MGITDSPKNLDLVQNSNETSIVDDIEEAERKSGYVLVDLEGTASATVANAIIRADYVLLFVRDHRTTQTKR